MVRRIILGLELLPTQLADLGMDEKQNIVSRFEDAFRQMWVNNGNTLSKMYAGTGALCSGGSKVILKLLRLMLFYLLNLFKLLTLLTAIGRSSIGREDDPEQPS